MTKLETQVFVTLTTVIIMNIIIIVQTNYRAGLLETQNQHLVQLVINDGVNNELVLLHSLNLERNFLEITSFELNEHGKRKLQEQGYVYEPIFINPIDRRYPLLQRINQAGGKTTWGATNSSGDKMLDRIRLYNDNYED